MQLFDEATIRAILTDDGIADEDLLTALSVYFRTKYPDAPGLDVSSAAGLVYGLTCGSFCSFGTDAYD